MQLVCTAQKECRRHARRVYVTVATKSFLAPCIFCPMYLSRVTFGLQAELWMDGDRADATGRKLDLCVADSEASPRRHLAERRQHRVQKVSATKRRNVGGAALSQDAPIYLMHRFKSRAADITISQITRQLARDFIFQILSAATRAKCFESFREDRTQLSKFVNCVKI
jgi:hypothetical protein